MDPVHVDDPARPLHLGRHRPDLPEPPRTSCGTSCRLPACPPAWRGSKASRESRRGAWPHCQSSGSRSRRTRCTSHRVLPPRSVLPFFAIFLPHTGQCGALIGGLAVFEQLASQKQHASACRNPCTLTHILSRWEVGTTQLERPRTGTLPALIMQVLTHFFVL